MQQKENKISEFWCWFQSNAIKLMDIRSVDDPKYIELEKQVGMLGDIDFEIGGGGSEGKLDIILTAHGDESKFALIDEIALAAPQLENWRVYALKPPLVEEMSIVFMGEQIETKSIWLKTRPQIPNLDRLDVQIAVPHSSESGSQQALQEGALIIIESYLGERVFSSRLDISGFVDLPDDPASDGFVHLKDVATYLGVYRVQ